MKYLAAALIAANGVAAFPNIMELEPRVSSGCTTNAACSAPYDVSDSKIGITGTPTLAQKNSAARTNCGQQGPCLSFDAAEQYVSTTGAHAYHSPSAAQIRGPCPGLNAAANHGYLPRSGYATIAQTITGLASAYGMGPLLGGFLAAYAIVFDGDLISRTWSIGGPQPASSLSKGLLGKPQGISWSHNKYEGDTSIARCDAYVNNGDAHSLDVNRFKYAYETGMGDDRYTLDKFAQDFAKNTYRSEAQNAYYTAPLFSTTLVAPAAYNFVINFMSNHSEAEPSGYLNGDIFKEFFAVTGDYPNFTWQPGQEKIPNNWYRRPSINAYQVVGGVFGDLVPEFLAYPPSFRFGGNVNGPNSYVGVNISDVTGGVYNAETLFQGDNLACFFFRQQEQVIPDFLEGSPNPLKAGYEFLVGTLTESFSSLNCPQIAKYDYGTLFSKYPGHSYSPTGPATNC